MLSLSLFLIQPGFLCLSSSCLTHTWLHNHYLAKSWSPYSSLAAHILIWTFHSTNIDKVREIESTQLSITTFPVLSMPIIFALWMESHSHSYFCTLRIKHLLCYRSVSANPSHTLSSCLFFFFFFFPHFFCLRCYTSSSLWEPKCCIQSIARLKVLGGLKKSLDKQQLDLMHH